MTHAIISSSLAEVIRFMDLMGIPRDSALPLAPGTAICGRQIDQITLVGWMPGDGKTPALQQLSMQWWNESVRCRLPVDHKGLITYVQYPMVIPLPR